MFLVKLADIPEEGLAIDHDAARHGWVREAVTRALGAKVRPGAPARVALMLARSGDQISMTGVAYLHLHPTCDRCLKGYDVQQQVPIHIVYSRGIQVEDLNFSSYEGNQIDVEAAVVEQMLLAQPMQSLCRPNCRGLCPACRADLNAGPCACTAPRAPSPFAALRRVKLPAVKGRRRPPKGRA